MRCKRCDEPMDENMDFCPNCGAPVAAASSAGAHTTLLPNTPRDVDPPKVAAPTAYQQPSYQQPSYQPITQQSSSYQPGGYQPGGYMPAPLPNSQAAIVSLVFGILSYVMLPFIGSIVAIVAGHIAKREIRDSNGQLGGGGMATAGLVLGYLQIGITALVICLILALAVIGAAADA
jgi:hypothetical protein